MNKKNRQLVIRNLGTVGASLLAITSVILMGPNLFINCLAGTLGYALFTGAAVLLVRFLARLGAKPPSDWVCAFSELTKTQEALAGGKGSTLARLHQEGLGVPGGFVILPAAFTGDELKYDAWKLAQIQLARLRKSDPNGSFAIRSSAQSEDSAQASFAGEFETVLDVSSDEDILRAIHTVRRSRHNTRVQAYSEAQGIQEAQHEIAVVIQKLIQPQFSGVLFTVNPVTGNLAQMSGNMVEGLGEKLVSGQANPLTFTYERPKGTYAGPAELQKRSRQLYQMACELETILGGPQDIEWAVAHGRVYLLQSRPITTLNGYTPATAEWNDTHQGNFLWSATNLSEAFPEVQTPFTTSLRLYLEKRGGPSLTVKNYPLNGVIGGRFYVNISVQVSAFNTLFGGNSRRTYRELAGWWGEIPENLEIPLIPLTRQEWFNQVMPTLLRTNGQLGKYRKQIPAFVANNQRVCAELRDRIRQANTPAILAALWHAEIYPQYRDSLFYIVSASSDQQMRLEQELVTLMGTEDANALLSTLGGLSSRLESLGPMADLAKVLRGEMTRQAYLEAYGHRGVNEGECAWPRPAEDPAWLDHQLAEFAQGAMDIEAWLAKQQAAFDAAWQRFEVRYPKKVKRMRRRLEEVAQAASRREVVRSEATRVGWGVRDFALRAGEMLGTGDDVFFLTIDETLAALEGDSSARQYITTRKETHERYRALPPYPTLICGRFDPFDWAADPHRRSDLFDANAPAAAESTPGAAEQIKGFAGALGVVEGIVRRLDRLEDSHQLQTGEILVTTLTNIGWTPLFPRAAAIVTDLGAPLSHAAIVARELGIPAVVGCGDATMRLKTGDRVRVDGGKGLVEILAVAAK